MTIFLDKPPLGYDKPPIGHGGGITVHLCEIGRDRVLHYLLFDLDGFICSTDSEEDFRKLMIEQKNNSTGTSPNAEKLYYWRSGAREYVDPGAAKRLQAERKRRATAISEMMPRGPSPKAKGASANVSLEDLGLA